MGGSTWYDQFCITNKPAGGSPTRYLNHLPHGVHFLIMKPVLKNDPPTFTHHIYAHAFNWNNTIWTLIPGKQSCILCATLEGSVPQDSASYCRHLPTSPHFVEMHVSTVFRCDNPAVFYKINTTKFIVLCYTIYYTRVGTLIVATIYLQLIQNRYMFRSFTVLQCSHQHCVQPVAGDVEVVGYL